MVDVESQQAGGPGRKNPVRMSRLTIVDLAGAERLAVSGTGDDPTLLAETQSINSSLTALGTLRLRVPPLQLDVPPRTPKTSHFAPGVVCSPADVLSALSSNNQELWLIPYRNNPLTWLLRDALGGNSKTIMLAHCHSTAQNFRQSKVTLMYATRAKKIRNRIRSNVVAADDSELQAKMVVIERLRDTITANREQLRKAQERRDEAVKEAVHLRQELARVAEQQRTARAATPAAAATPGAVAATAKPAGTEHSEQDDDSEQTIVALKEELRKAQARADGAMMSELSDTLRRLQRLAAEKRFLEMQLAASTDAEHQQVGPVCGSMEGVHGSSCRCVCWTTGNQSQVAGEGAARTRGRAGNPEEGAGQRRTAGGPATHRRARRPRCRRRGRPGEGAEGAATVASAG